MTTEQKHTITIPGLPEGWRVKKIKLWDALYEITPGSHNYDPCINTAGFKCELIVEKIKPRRIVLEETEKAHITRDMQQFRDGDVSINLNAKKIWRLINVDDSTFSEGE